MTTLLIAEHDNASLKDATNKALTAAAALGADVEVLVAGQNAKAAADAAAKLAGVKKVLLADGDLYAHDLAEPLAALVVSLAPGYDAIVAPATSRFTVTESPSTSMVLAKVPCGRFISAASIWPVWLLSSSMACLPRMTRPGASSPTTPLRILATASGSTVASVFTWMPRSAPMASAVRIVSAAPCGPMETTTISVAAPFSFRRMAS